MLSFKKAKPELSTLSEKKNFLESKARAVECPGWTKTYTNVFGQDIVELKQAPGSTVRTICVELAQDQQLTFDQMSGRGASTRRVTIPVQAKSASGTQDESVQAFKPKLSTSNVTGMVKQPSIASGMTQKLSLLSPLGGSI